MKHVAVVIDRHGKSVAGKYTTIKGARRAADKKDNEYGGYRYHAYTLSDEVPCKHCGEQITIKFTNQCINHFLAI